MVKKEKLYRNVNNEYLYLFNWVEGGFNDVWAPNKREAIKRIKKEFGGSLTPDTKSMRRCTYSQYQEQNRLGWMMSM